MGSGLWYAPGQGKQVAKQSFPECLLFDTKVWLGVWGAASQRLRLPQMLPGFPRKYLRSLTLQMAEVGSFPSLGP